ncbi:hypothetical protein OIU85_009193 [Salix viminalis]|uniref:Uncharacterized protein n=4 Tax=Salix TaxID=40685 RepID=A0A6N2LQT7_SALVM|nr:hypothetical protein DKX38_010985 [Salix brachista]KAG5241165.1 protein translocase [Salix suchowensis]KAJ6367176.1 hypothetical protein OIU77_003529 [Salix suchowensis]KAJ6678702.1 hypothetical protein OIU85_009193 [Salix viminalis]KAJ6739996.1 hypothetical protein OIU79_000197 [Salix purpurea]
MGFGALRNAIRPLSRTLITHTGTSSTTPFLASRPEFRLSLGGGAQSPWTQMIRHFSFLSEAHPFDRLTSTRFPKRRPVDKPRRKRASLKPPGPYAWVQYVPGEPIKPNNPNVGSVKRRNERKRIRQRQEFILAEKKKRKAEMQEANRKKRIVRVERKMAAVARDREWAQKLAELQRLEEEKKKSMS